MNKLKILTDIQIKQCLDWCQQTQYLFEGSLDAEKTVVERFKRLLKNAKHYDVVVTANLRTAQFFGLYRTLFKKKWPKHIVLELMLDEARDSLRWKIKKHFQKICFSSVDVVFVSARSEIGPYADRLGLSSEQIQFLPFHTNVISPEPLIDNDSYIFSAGKTGRDYATLAAAVAGFERQVVVVSDSSQIAGVRFPDNVRLFCDIPYGQYMSLLRGCSLVVVPLKRLAKSTGQVVFLEAMALGKPVIATATTGTEDYIEDGVTGYLVPPKSPADLRAALEEFIENSNDFMVMAENALEQVRQNHTFQAYTDKILNVAEMICNETSPLSRPNTRCPDGNAGRGH